MEKDFQEHRKSYSQHIDTYQNNGTRKHILSMQIEISDQNTDTIDIREGDDTRKLATNFWIKHGLDINIVKHIQQAIQTQLQNLKDKSPKMALSRSHRKEIQTLSKPTSHRSGSQQNGSNPPTERQQEIQRVFPNFKSAKSLQNSRNNSLTQGPDIYKRGLAHIQKVHNSLKKLRGEKDVQYLQESSFHPRINKSMASLATINHSREMNASAVELSNRKKYVSEKFEFTPHINNTSQKLARSTSKGATVFKSLHDEADRRKTRMNQFTEGFIKENYPFRPKISKESSFDSLNRDEKPVYERLILKKQKSERSLVSKRVKAQELVDASTGQKLFSPAIKSKFEKENQQNKHIDLFERLGGVNGELNPTKARTFVINEDIASKLMPLIDHAKQIRQKISFKKFSDYMDNLKIANSKNRSQKIYNRWHRSRSSKNEKSQGYVGKLIRSRKVSGHSNAKRKSFI